MTVPEYNLASTGVDLIAAERRRQMKNEGWTHAHDDDHTKAELTRAAVNYAVRAIDQIGWPTAGQGLMWPWDSSWWKPSDDRVRNLVKAGALIAAEIDRLARAEGTGGDRDG